GGWPPWGWIGLDRGVLEHLAIARGWACGRRLRARHRISHPRRTALMINRQWRLASRPQGAVDRGNFELVETQVPAAPAGGGKVLLRTEMLLCMPTIRNFISGKRSDYHPTIELGELIMSPGVG